MIGSARSAEGQGPQSGSVPEGVRRQEGYRQRYRLLNLGWRDSQEIYLGLVAQHMGPQVKVLDVGCGHADFLAPAYRVSEHIYGLEPDPVALARNTTVKHKLEASVESIPMPDGFFDLATMAWVAEHLPRPLAALREIHRVLRPGGRLLVLTPNAWNYNAWLVRAVPNRFHDYLTRRLYGRQDRDTYPVRYRMNTPGKLDRLMAVAGFRRVRLILNGDPSYISFNEPLFQLARVLEGLFDLKGLRPARVHLIGLYER
ncbi:MAG: class I SAM-dependent methyltransferase [Candidatus Dormibacteria bacterium]